MVVRKLISVKGDIICKISVQTKSKILFNAETFFLITSFCNSISPDDTHVLCESFRYPTHTIPGIILESTYHETIERIIVERMKRISIPIPFENNWNSICLSLYWRLKSCIFYIIHALVTPFLKKRNT